MLGTRRQGLALPGETPTMTSGPGWLRFNLACSGCLKWRGSFAVESLQEALRLRGAWYEEKYCLGDQKTGSNAAIFGCMILDEAFGLCWSWFLPLRNKDIHYISGLQTVPCRAFPGPRFWKGAERVRQDLP